MISLTIDISMSDPSLYTNKGFTGHVESFERGVRRYLVRLLV